MTTEAGTSLTPKPTRLVAVAAMILSAACWGFATVMSKGALMAFSPPVLLTLQLVASVTFLWLATGFAGQLTTLRRATPLAAFSGLLEPGLAYAIGTFGLMLTTAGNASLIATTEPLLIVALAWLLFGERIDVRTGAAILAAMTGVALVTGAHYGGGMGTLLGDALVVLGTVFAALYVIVSRRLVVDVAPAALAALQQSVGLAFSVALLVAWLPLPAAFEEIARADVRIIGLAVLSGIVQYALAFWFYLIGLRRLSTSTAALFLALIPVFGLSGAVIFLGETITLVQAVGTVTIIMAVASVGRTFAVLSDHASSVRGTKER